MQVKYLFLVWCIAISSQHKSYALQLLSDTELSHVEAKSLFNLNYIAPNQNSNPNQDIGFYRLGMDVDVELNVNIKRLQLGCGGVKGAGCDIDIEDISLAGINPINGSYAGTDAKINNPFIEFAIKNPNSSAIREIIGFRLGALGILGKLGLGSNQDTSTLKDDHGGIHSLSGDLKLTLNNVLLKNLSVQTKLPRPLSAIFGESIEWLKAEALIKQHSSPLFFNRSSTATLTKIEAVAQNVNALTLLGNFDPAKLLNGATFENVTLKDYPTAAFHEIILSEDYKATTPTSDVALSFQKEQIYWQKLSTGNFSTTASQSGWWLSVPEVQISDIIVDQKINLGVYETVAGLVQKELIINPIDSGQKGMKNCYGELKFC